MSLVGSLAAAATHAEAREQRELLGATSAPGSQAATIALPGVPIPAPADPVAPVTVATPAPPPPPVGVGTPVALPDVLTPVIDDVVVPLVEVLIPPPPSAPGRFAAAPAGGQTFTYGPYADLGAWLDVYDWSVTFTGGNPGAGIADIDRMAALGVRTIFIQASKWDSPTDVLEPERLRPLIDRAHALGMSVVGWYLPTLVDPTADLRRLLAISAFGVDGLAVDIEARNVADVAERNRRLVGLSQALRQALPGEVLSAVVLEPVLIEDVNPNYWPAFPWAEIAPLYDVWQPMSYWSNRRASSGYRDGYNYTAANIDRVRAHIGRPDAVVHSIGGIGDLISPTDIEAMAQASAERGAIGGSIYDYRTTGDALWPTLTAFNS